MEVVGSDEFLWVGRTSLMCGADRDPDRRVERKHRQAFDCTDPESRYGSYL
jgi:hypothetical protein